MKTIRPKQDGFTLLEVLVALVVLSIGLLGVSKIQALGLRASTDSNLRTEATFMANDMIERMRANRPSADSGYYAGIVYNAIDCTNPPAKICSEGTAGTANDCTTTEMADEDAHNWYCRVTASLPNAAVAVSQAASVYSVQISWDGLDEEGNTQARDVSASFIP